MATYFYGVPEVYSDLVIASLTQSCILRIYRLR